MRGAFGAVTTTRRRIMRCHIRLGVVLAVAMSSGIAACNDAPTESSAQRQPRVRVSADALHKLRGEVVRLSASEYAYSGAAADSLLEHQARLAATRGELEPLTRLREFRGQSTT